MMQNGIYDNNGDVRFENDVETLFLGTDESCTCIDGRSLFLPWNKTPYIHRRFRLRGPIGGLDGV